MADDKITTEDLGKAIPPQIAEMLLILQNGSNGEYWSELIYLAYIGRMQLDDEIEQDLIDLEAN